MSTNVPGCQPFFSFFCFILYWQNYSPAEKGSNAILTLTNYCLSYLHPELLLAVGLSVLHEALSGGVSGRGQHELKFQ